MNKKQIQLEICRGMDLKHQQSFTKMQEIKC